MTSSDPDNGDKSGLAKSRPEMLAFRIGSITNDVYLSTIQMLERVIATKKNKKKEERLRLQPNSRPEVTWVANANASSDQSSSSSSSSDDMSASTGTSGLSRRRQKSSLLDNNGGDEEAAESQEISSVVAAEEEEDNENETSKDEERAMKMTEMIHERTHYESNMKDASASSSVMNKCDKGKGKGRQKESAKTAQSTSTVLVRQKDVEDFSFPTLMTTQSSRKLVGDLDSGEGDTAAAAVAVPAVTVGIPAGSSSSSSNVKETASLSLRRRSYSSRISSAGNVEIDVERKSAGQGARDRKKRAAGHFLFDEHDGFARDDAACNQHEEDLEAVFSSPLEELKCDNMNYFRNRFQRQQSLSTESVLRDVRKRRSEIIFNNDVLGAKEVHQPDSSQETAGTESSVATNATFLQTTSVVRRRCRTQNPEDDKTAQGDSQTYLQRRRRVFSEVPQQSLNAVDDLTQQSLPNQQRRSDEAEPCQLGGSPPTILVTLSKSSSLRRRRHPSNEHRSEGSNPVKKGNFTVRNEEAAEVKEANSQRDEEEKLLNSIEIKSAAQWKAMSQRISWRFDENEQEKTSEPEKPSNQYSFTISASSNSISFADGFQPTKPQQLRLICWKVKPWKQSKVSSRLFSSQFAVGWGVDCDEVYPGLFIGDKEAASNIQFLQKLGITHILNTAEGKEEGLVDLSETHYSGTNISYLGFPLWDTPTCNITPYLGCASDYISSAIDHGGKCLVNCQMGVSRSSTCAMAYLMIKKQMKAADVLTQFRQNRDVRPNDGFLEQIVNLDNDLRANREHGEERKISLSKLTDHRLLPRAWNHEFWTKEVTEEEIGMPLVKLGEPCPLLTQQQSFASSKGTSRIMSRRSSRRSLTSRRSSRSSRSLSRHSSFKASNAPIDSSDNNPGHPNPEPDDEDWEWVWEDDEEDEDEAEGEIEEENEENKDPMMAKNSSLTTEKLEKVKDIIEKPEERWRILWQNTRNCDTPSSVNSNRSSISNASKLSNIIQPGLDVGDPLSAVKVGSAKQWKAISRRLTINLDGIDLDDESDCSAVAAATDFVRPATPTDFNPTTVQQLRLLCWRVKPWDQPRARHLFSSVLASGWGVDCDEVFPSLFVGDEASARNIKFLQKIGITHVLNAAEGPWTDCSFVDLTADYYQGSGITYQGIQLWDSSKVRILPYFGCFNEFIGSALKAGGKCLVHCQMGVSRSCTAAMAYMMLTAGWDAIDTMREFRKRRDVRPNDHFLAQVVELDNELRKERLFGIPRTIRLYSLADLDRLPKPWHFEFWDSEPDPDTLPFKLCHLEDSNQADGASSGLQIEERPESSGDELLCEKSDNLVTGVKRQSMASVTTSQSSDYEWEYYDDDDDDEEEEEEQGAVKTGEQEKGAATTAEHAFLEVDHSVGSAREWREISAKLTEGSLHVREEKGEEETQVESRTVTAPRKSFDPTLEKHLRLVCWKVKPWMEKKSSKMFSSQFAVLWNVDCDEVHPNLFIGDASTATNIKFLKHLNITHVLNTAEGDDENLVNLNETFYDGSGITYKGFLMWDSTWFDVAPFIEEAVEFIDQSLSSGGRCLVNCQMGVSRSSTCALAYMMIKVGFKAVDALRQFRMHRDVRPNDGFIQYLVRLDNTLRMQREG